MDLIKINFIKHPSGQMARHEIYRKENGELTGIVIPLQPIQSENTKHRKYSSD